MSYCQICLNGEAKSQVLTFGCTLLSHIENHLNIQLQVSTLLVCRQCCELLQLWENFYNKARANLSPFSQSRNALTGVSILQEEVRKLNELLSTPQHNGSVTDSWQTEPVESVVAIKEEVFSPQPVPPSEEDEPQQECSYKRRKSLRCQTNNLFPDLINTRLVNAGPSSDNNDNTRSNHCHKRKQQHEGSSECLRTISLDPRVKDCKIILDRAEVQRYLNGKSPEVAHTTQRTPLASRVHDGELNGNVRRRASLDSETTLNVRVTRSRKSQADDDVIVPARSTRRSSLSHQATLDDVPRARIPRRSSLSAQLMSTGELFPTQEPLSPPCVYGDDLFVMQPRDDGPNCSPSIALNQLTCKFCLQTFNVTYQLDEHIKYHHPNASPRPPQRSVNSPQVVETHQFKIPKLMIFQCTACDIFFTNASQYQLHKKTRHQ